MLSLLRLLKKTSLLVLPVLAIFSAIMTTQAFQDKKPPNYHQSIARRMPDTYTVVLKQSFHPDLEVKALEKQIEKYADSLAEKYNGKTGFILVHLRGFSVTLPNEKSAIEICTLGEIAYVEEASIISPPLQRSHSDSDSDNRSDFYLDSLDFSWLVNSRALAGINQPSPIPQLDRIDQRFFPLNSSYQSKYDGSGTTIYIVDSGINSTHQEFGGRVAFGTDVVGDATLPKGKDCHGHGTTVAALVAGARYGVAKNAKLINVRVLDCLINGDTTKLQAAFNWIITHQATTNYKQAVLNFSVGFPSSIFTSATSQLISTVISKGIIFVGAAGNDGGLGIEYNPAANLNVIAVGATINTSDMRAIYSNYGSRIDIYAPGNDAPQPSIANDTDYTSIRRNGTSFSAPLVAGVAALYLETNPDGSNNTIKDAFKRNATRSVVTSNVPTFPPLADMLYSNFKINVVTSAAAYKRVIAPDSIAAIFGENLNAFNSVFVLNPSYTTSGWNATVAGISPGQINWVRLF